MRDKEKVGYVAIFRKIQNHWIWDDPEMFHAWMDILLSAQFHDSSKVIHGKVIFVPRGSWFVAQTTLETRWKWSKNRIRHFLRSLERSDMITVKGTPDGTMLTIVNYELYQNPGTTKSTPKGTTEGTTKGTTEGTTEGTHTNHINQENQEKKKKGFSMLRSCTWSEEEIQRYMEEVNEGKNPFGSQDVENEYFRIALDKRRERGIY